MDKFLHDLGYGTRKDIAKFLRAHKVTVNGQMVTKPAFQVKASDDVCIDDESIRYEPQCYLMLHKPKGVVSARTDAQEQTVLSLLPDNLQHRDITMVGRLDKDTTGLLLLTNDGAMVHQLTNPKKHQAKVYHLEYEGKLVEDAVEQCEKGLVLHDFVALPSRLRLLEEGKAELTIYEGKYHQVKRMIKALGGEVTALHRVQMGPLVLDDSLEAGEWRYLTEEEVTALKK